MDTNEQTGEMNQVQTEPQVPSGSKFIIQKWEKIGAVVAVLLVLGYLASAKYLNFWPFTISVAPISTPTLTLSETPDSFANWQTYRNEEYGFEFKYPAGWNVVQLTEFSNGVFEVNDKVILPNSEPSEYGIRVSVNKRQDDIPLGEYFFRFDPTQEYIRNAKEVHVDGIKGLQSFEVISENEPPAMGNVKLNPGLFKNTMVFKNENRFSISTKGLNIEETNNIYNQFLSTFKFIEQTAQQKEIIEADVRKIADIGQFRVMAELYYDKYKKYPKALGNTAEDRWRSFSVAIVNEGLFPKELPPSYDYQTDSSRQSAVFKAVLEAPDHPDVKLASSVNRDADGIIYGLDCNKPNYCLVIGVQN